MCSSRQPEAGADSPAALASINPDTYSDARDSWCDRCGKDQGVLPLNNGLCAKCAEPNCTYCDRPTFGDCRRMVDSHGLVTVVCGVCWDKWADAYLEEAS